MNYDIRCCVCGKFTVPADTAIEYGSYYDLEPPDPIFWCAKCAKLESKQAHIDCYWIQPKFYNAN